MEALAFRRAQQVLEGHSGAVKKQLTRVGGVLTELFEAASHLKSWQALWFHDEQRNATGAFAAGANRHHEEICNEAVRDEGLSAADLEVVALPPRRRFERFQVRSAARLGHRDGG